MTAQENMFGKRRFEIEGTEGDWTEITREQCVSVLITRYGSFNLSWLMKQVDEGRMVETFAGRVRMAEPFDPQLCEKCGGAGWSTLGKAPCEECNTDRKLKFRPRYFDAETAART